MSYAGLLLTVVTPNHRYIVRRDQMLGIRIIANTSDLERPDERGKPVIGTELGPLLDPHDTGKTSPRQHALIVPTRRWSVALMVERVDDVHLADVQMQKLPSIIAKNIQRPWFLGILMHNDVLMLVLDLRQIAQDVLIMKSEEKKQSHQQTTPVEQTNDQ
jgi:hypothetical protein